MVVPALITSSQVSLKSNIGPVTAQATTVPAAIANAPNDPAAIAVADAIRPDFLFSMMPPRRVSATLDAHPLARNQIDCATTTASAPRDM